MAVGDLMPIKAISSVCSNNGAMYAVSYVLAIGALIILGSYFADLTTVDAVCSKDMPFCSLMTVHSNSTLKPTTKTNITHRPVIIQITTRQAYIFSSNYHSNTTSNWQIDKYRNYPLPSRQPSSGNISMSKMAQRNCTVRLALNKIESWVFFIIDSSMFTTVYLSCVCIWSES